MELELEAYTPKKLKAQVIWAWPISSCETFLASWFCNLPPSIQPDQTKTKDLVARCGRVCYNLRNRKVKPACLGAREKKTETMKEWLFACVCVRVRA